MSMFLKGEKIYLRAIAKSDVNEDYLFWINDPEVTSGLDSGKKPSTISELDQYVTRCISEPNVIMFAICDVKENKHIGNIKLDAFDSSARTCQLGLLIGDKNSWGKGIGKEACRMAINYAFSELNMRKVLLAVYANNPNAKRLYESLGFKLEGTLREQVFANGEYFDKHYMGVFKSEFK